MKINVLPTIDDKTDYMTALEAVTGAKTSFTEEEKAKLLDIYVKNAERGFGFEGETLVKAVLALDVPGVNLLDKDDADALTTLCELCKDWEPDTEMAEAAKTAVLSGTVSGSLSLALARAALDALADQKDITPYREDIKALAEFLKDADGDAFSDASVFLVRVRERVR